ncbi:MAG TPA: nuclear transport factor 2 family protein [Steroidobacteraceae bacterium]|nr:nuclear transport factor 2 family protein [Steroidobacteraceae bacterium]
MSQIEAKAARFKSAIALVTLLVAAPVVLPVRPALAATAGPESSLLERLAARQDIEELFAQYGASLDRRDFEAFGRLFTEDAVYGSGATPTHGRAAIQAQLQQTITANPSHLPGPDFHLYFDASIHVDGDHATAHSMGAYLIPDEKSPGGWRLIFLVSYEDTLVRQNGHWLFSQRMLHPAATPAKR